MFRGEPIECARGIVLRNEAPLDTGIPYAGKPMDNLNIKGIEDDKPRRRGKTRGKTRKPFAIESRLVHDPDLPRRSVLRQFGLGEWGVWGRYMTASRRDQAYAALVKREAASRLPRWGSWRYRKMG